MVPEQENASEPTPPEDHCARIRCDTEALMPLSSVAYTRRVAVPLLENLGYRLAQETSGELATSAFILAAELEKRLSGLEAALSRDEDDIAG